MQVDKNKIYKYDKYSYKNFVNLTDEELLLILQWRNHPDIRRCMNNTEPITEESHLNYCHNLKNKEDVIYWLILKENKPVGVLNIIDIDYENGICEPGFYLAPEVMGRGESIFVLSNYKDFLLNELGFHALVGHNYADNKPALVFTMFFGAEITGVEQKNGRISVQSLLKKESLVNGVGTERLTAKYARFYREWDMDKAINEYGK